jgi:hypothetical protein
MKQAMAIGLTLLALVVPVMAYPQPAIPESLKGVIPEYTGQKVLMAVSSGGSDHVTLEIPADFKTVTGFYKQHFAEDGWEVEMEMSMEDTNMISLSKEGQTLGIIIGRTEEYSSSVSFTRERR